jgi:hypothetical protein
MLCPFDKALLKREANETAAKAAKAEAGDHHATRLPLTS